MVAVLISDTSEDGVFQFPDHRCLLVGKNVFQRLCMSVTQDPRDCVIGSHLLDHAAPIHLKGQAQDMPLHLVGENLLLLLVAVFEKLLNDVVTKDIRHQLQSVALNFTEHLLLLVAVRGL